MSAIIYYYYNPPRPAGTPPGRGFKEIVVYDRDIVSDKNVGTTSNPVLREPLHGGDSKIRNEKVYLIRRSFLVIDALLVDSV